eukprot:9540509-Alexandrium_andersonii.AAC.1
MLEASAAHHSPSAATAVDLFQMAGMPPGMIMAYATFQEALTFRGQYASGYGEPRRRLCSIPQ